MRSLQWALVTVFIVALCHTCSAREKVIKRFLPAPEISNIKLKKKENAYIWYKDVFFIFQRREKSYNETNPYIYYRHRKPYTGYAEGFVMSVYGSQTENRFTGYFKDGIRDSLWKVWNTKEGEIAIGYYKDGVKDSLWKTKSKDGKRTFSLYKQDSMYTHLVESLEIDTHWADTTYKYEYNGGDTTIKVDLKLSYAHDGPQFRFSSDHKSFSVSFNKQNAMTRYSSHDLDIEWSGGDRHLITYYYMRKLGDLDNVKIYRNEGTNSISRIEVRDDGHGSLVKYFPIESTSPFPKRFFRMEEDGKKIEVRIDWPEIERRVAAIPSFLWLYPIVQGKPLGSLLPMN